MGPPRLSGPRVATSFAPQPAGARSRACYYIQRVLSGFASERAAGERSPEPRPRRRASAAERITAPIPLLAYMGVVVEGVIGALAYVLIDRTGDPALRVVTVVAALLVPVLLILCVYRLISRYPENLYGPQSYMDVRDFVAVLSHGRDRAEEVSRLAPRAGTPFVPTGAASPEQLAHLERHAHRWQPVLEGMDPDEFFALHSWFNERGSNPDALTCIAISTAKGMANSRNYSFMAASLRKLGRLAEAEASAQVALRLDAGNPDAHYNLAHVYLLMGRLDDARRHAKAALEAAPGEYEARLPAELIPDARTARVRR